MPEYKVKEHEKTPYEKPKYEEKPVEPTKLPEIYEVPLKEITPGYYKPKEEYKPTEEPKGQSISKCLFGVIVWTKTTTKILSRFLP